MSEKLNYFSAIRFLGKYIKDYKKNFVKFYVGWLVDSILTMILPILLGIMIDEIVYYQNLESFLWVSVFFFICIIFSGVLYFLIYAQHGYLMNMFVFSIRRDVFKHLQKCDAQFLAGSATGDIISTTLRYPGECMHFIIRNIIHFINMILMIGLYGTYMVLIDWRLGAIAFCAAVFSTAINMKFSKKIRKLGDEERRYYGKHVSWMYEIITALRDIRILGAREKVEEDFSKNHQKLFGVVVKSKITSLTAENVIAFVNLIIQLTIYAMVAYLTVRGNITLGVMTVIFNFYDKFAYKVSGVSLSYLDAQKRISCIQKVYDLLHAPVEQGGTKKLDVKNGEILFQNATFGYDGQKEDSQVLKNVTLKINPGEHIAIVGKSGCGKTTLAYLLIGFYRLKSGEIKIDGQNLAECTLESIRRSIGLVQQDVLVFDGTIRENLLMGNLKAKEEQLIEACQAAGLGEYIASLPQGLDTVIGKHGIGLSGGQKQRIAIARIFLKNPAIVILDEATSALDNKTEEGIHEAWKTALAGKTAIVIAHRQSSVMLCERVAILEDGQIVETGQTGELIRESKRFGELFAIEKEVNYSGQVEAFGTETVRR